MSATAIPRVRRRGARRRAGDHHPPTHVPQETLDPFTSIMRTFAEREQRRYAGSGVRIGSSKVIHQAEQVPWLLGLSLPAPACHAGFAVTLGRMSPVRGAVVSCRRCLSVRRGTQPSQVDGQIPLW